MGHAPLRFSATNSGCWALLVATRWPPTVAGALRWRAGAAQQAAGAMSGQLDIQPTLAPAAGIKSKPASIGYGKTLTAAAESTACLEKKRLPGR